MSKSMVMKTTSYLQKYFINLHEILAHYAQDVYRRFGIYEPTNTNLRSEHNLWGHVFDSKAHNSILKLSQKTK